MRHLKLTIATATIIMSFFVLTAIVQAQLPNPGMEIDPERTAIVLTDPQNDFLSPDGVTWGVVGESVTENNTVKNIETLFKLAKENGIPVFISPHYYYPTDHGWKFGGALEKLMHNIGMFDRKGALNLEGFAGSGADWLEVYKPYIEDGETVIVSPHKVYGPESNDLALQLRKRGIDKVILAGMSANLCVESHMRELLEEGFEVAVVKDATAAAKVPDGDGYAAALVNFRYMANTVWTTEEVEEALSKSAVWIDATKVSPDTYKVLTENDFMRIVSVIAKPGDRDEWHSHLPMAVYVATDMKIRLHSQDGEYTDMEAKAGQTMWRKGGEKHSMENIGSTDTHIILVEFKNL
jgi:nicotinamidase-related amidase